MTDYFIASGVYKDETFLVDQYILPRSIYSKNGNELKLKKLREKYLEEGKTNLNVSVFKEYMKDNFPDIKYIQEFPIPILNSFLCYRCLDFFLPYLGFGVELDSHYHDETGIEDSRSDLYVYKKFGVQILRLRLASESHRKEDLERLERKIKKTKPLEFQWPLDFTDSIADTQRKKYLREFLELESLEKQYSEGLYNGNLILSVDQESRLKHLLRRYNISYSIMNP